MSRQAQLRLKRIMDVLLSAGVLLLLSPVLGAVALIGWIRIGRPILFRQKRGGFGGTEFVLLKFRTMSNEALRDGRMLDDETRLTSWGRALRRTSLDEVPQFWNVLKGDMSLVGPRPLLSIYTQRYNETQRRRLEMRPGVTGLAQIRGRNSLAWNEKFRFDVEYVDHWSLGLDCRILARTVAMTLSGSGISYDAHTTMPEFLGSGSEEPHT